MESWSGAMEWSFGVEFGVNEVRFGVLVALLGHDLALIDQFLVKAYFYVEFCT